MDYRKEIDGLRALAVLPVLLFHSGVPYLTGGFIGVDVFFVISGFLITTILLDEIDQQKFSIIKFYERRARRILPALLAVIVFSSLMTTVITSSPYVLSNYGESVLSVTLFASNIFFWLQSGYFGHASEVSPLLHTWSLAVEEQFYLFFPLIAAWFYPFGRKKFGYLLIITVLLSLGIAEWGWRNSPTGNFYLIPSRAWELLAGSLAALVISKPWINSLSKAFSGHLALIGMLTVIVSYFTFTPSTPHPGLLTIFPVFGTVLILLFCHDQCLAGKILGLRPLVFTGLISYSLYLWHQPVLAFAKIQSSAHLSAQVQAMLLLGIFIMSYYSWRYIEQPFRNRQQFPAAKIGYLASGAVAVMLILGGGFQQNIYFQKFINPDDMQRYDVLLTANNSHEQQQMFNDTCKIWAEEFNANFTTRFEECSKKHSKAIFILGGSHGMDLYNAISMNSANPFIVSVSRGYCRAHEMIGDEKAPHRCQYQDFETFASEYADRISLVVYTQTPVRLFTKSMHLASENDLSEVHVDQVKNYLAKLKNEYALNVMMIGMLPPMIQSPIYLDYKGKLEPQLIENTSENTLRMTKYLDGVFEAKLKAIDVPYVTKFAGFKLSLPEDLLYDGKLTYSDNKHISYTGENVFGRRLVNYLFSHGFSEFIPL